MAFTDIISLIGRQTWRKDQHGFRCRHACFGEALVSVCGPSHSTWKDTDSPATQMIADLLAIAALTANFLLLLPSPNTSDGSGFFDRSRPGLHRVSARYPFQARLPSIANKRIKRDTVGGGRKKEGRWGRVVVSGFFVVVFLTRMFHPECV